MKSEEKNQKLKLGILASGGGTNLQSIIDACEAGTINAEVCVVISNNENAKALERARNHNIPAFRFARKSFGSKKELEGAMLACFKEHGAQLVCLAGYMHIVGTTLLEPYAGCMINIHPALLPSFPGLEGQKQAWEYGVKVSGCTVHFVDDKMDHGPIIGQIAVDVKEDDTAETLQKRILEQEHKLYPRCIQLIAENKVRIDGRRVSLSS